MSRLRDYLRSIYGRRGVDGYDNWIGRNYGVLVAGARNNLSIAGSLGLHLGHKNPTCLPKDIDYVTESHRDALSFLLELQLILARYTCRYRILVNNKTRYVPDGATAHYRLESSMWSDVCVFIIPKVNYWHPCWLRVQSYKDIVGAAKEMEKRDGKARDILDLAEISDAPDHVESEEEWFEDEAPEIAGPRLHEDDMSDGAFRDWLKDVSKGGPLEGDSINYGGKQ